MRNNIMEEESPQKEIELKEKEIICVGCPKGCRIKIEARGDEIEKISGYSCQEGISYAKEEFNNPTRILPTTVRVKGGEFSLVPVKTAEAIPRDKLLPAMDVIAEVVVEAPVDIGDVIIENILNTGVDVVATRRIAKGK